MVLYRGASQLDGQPIVVVATGLAAVKTENHKTGDMIQTWIMARDIHPFEAVTNGQDASVCGQCPLRGAIHKLPDGSPVNLARTCYVLVAQSPAMVWKKYQDGGYRGRTDYSLLAGRPVRLGSYGDPCAVPMRVWQRLLPHVSGWTGYTHQWREPRFQAYREICMASVENRVDAELAKNMGWRTFLVLPLGEQAGPREFHCPASAEQGKRLTCATCMACDGANGAPGRASVVIWPHGPPATRSFHYLLAEKQPAVKHRKRLTFTDVQVLDQLRGAGTLSAGELASGLGRTPRAIATRLWHLKHLGLVHRVSRGIYSCSELKR